MSVPPVRDEFVKVAFQQRGIRLPDSRAMTMVARAVNKDVNALLDVRASQPLPCAARRALGRGTLR